MAAVQLTGIAARSPTLTYLAEGAIAQIKRAGTVAGFVELLCCAETYNVFLEHLQEWAERVDSGLKQRLP